MGTLTIEMTKTAIPQDFKSKFNGKEYKVNMPDSEMDGATDKLKKPADLKDAEKLKKRLKDVTPIATGLFSQFDNATIKSDITELGEHELEVKLKGGNFKAKLKLLSQAGKETRVVVVEVEARKLGAHPASVKLDGLSSVGSACPYPDDLAHLLKKMAKVESYVWSGKSGMGNGWTPEFKGHYTHTESSIKGWKSYVDEPSMKTKTTWRLLFTLDFVEKTEQVVVKVLGVRQEH